MVGGSMHVGTPKTHVTRSVPFPAFLQPTLEDLIARGKPTQRVLGDGHDYMKHAHSEAGWFAYAVRRSQKTEPNFHYVSHHDLRPCAASLAISSRATAKE